MGDLVVTDVAVTLLPQDYYNPPGMLNVSFPAIAFGDGSKTYPANGIPMPDMGMLGEFKKGIKRIIVTQPSDGYKYVWDKNYNTIRIYQSAAVSGGTVSANSAGTPTGNLAAATLTIAAPTGNLAAAALTMQAPTANLNDGTVAANTVSNLTVDVAAPTGNVANKVLTIEAPTGNVANRVVTMEALATHTHAISAEAAAGPLAELGNVAVAATSLDLMVIGQ